MSSRHIIVPLPHGLKQSWNDYAIQAPVTVLGFQYNYTCIRFCDWLHCSNIVYLVTYVCTKLYHCNFHTRLYLRTTKNRHGFILMQDFWLWTQTRLFQQSLCIVLCLRAKLAVYFFCWKGGKYAYIRVLLDSFLLKSTFLKKKQSGTRTHEYSHPN